MSGLSSPRGHFSQHKSTDSSKCQQTSPNNIVVCVTGGVEWCLLVWYGASHWYRLACLSIAVSLHKETTVPNEEA